jgi:lipid-A-disaccharide synthase
MDADSLPDETPLIFLIAAEHSGDLLGARLMSALRDETGGRIRFAGIGGARMTEQGLESLYTMSDFALMGILEILRHIPRLLRRIRAITAAALAMHPVVVVTIDAPDLTLRIARRLHGSGIPLIHYVAPTVWAWKPGRARKLATFLNRLLVVLPFEPPYFEVHGLPCDFVGHPAVENAVKGDGPGFRIRHRIPEGVPLLCAMPGSRLSEIRRLMPIYRETAVLLRDRFPDLRIVIPTVAHLHDDIASASADWPVPALLVHEIEEKHDAFAASNVALVKAGTSSIEVAIDDLPCVITQKISWFSAWLARRMLNIQLFSLVNILLKREAQPELIQEKCRPDLLAAALIRLFENPHARQEQIEAGRMAAKMLGLGEESPSRRAGHAVLRYIGVEEAPGATILPESA